MMKKSKRIAALALSLVLMLGVLPLGLSPEAEAASPTDALADIAYYGDREKCALTYEMAQTYVKALQHFSGEIYAEACLADLSGDGYPILFIANHRGGGMFHLVVVDRSGFYEGFREHGNSIFDSDNSISLEFCEVDGWPALALRKVGADYPYEFHTISTASITAGDHLDQGDGYWIVGDTSFWLEDEAEFEHYLYETLHYVPGELIADFSDYPGSFSLEATNVLYMWPALSDYADAVAPMSYSGMLDNIAYYGDPSKFMLSEDMANAYAEVIESMPAELEHGYFTGKLCAALADPADDGYPILITAYTDNSKVFRDMRFWGYENGSAIDAEITVEGSIWLGTMDGKGMIFSGDSPTLRNCCEETHRYYSVSKGEIKLEHTVECYFAYSNEWSPAYDNDNPNYLEGYAPDGAAYVIEENRFGGSFDLIDSTKLTQNGWCEMPCQYGWYLVLLDGKNVSDQCSPSNTYCMIPYIRPYNFGAIICDVAETPVAYLNSVAYCGVENRLSKNMCLASSMLTVLHDYYKLPFTDVPESAWYHQWVKEAYQMGLINGKTATTYCPKDNMSYAEAVKLAACMHQRYTDGEVTLENGKDDWRSTYYDYCLENGIIPAAPEGEEPGYDELFAKASENIDRKTFVWLFSRTRPAKALREIHDIPDGSIPDVPVDDGIWDDGIYLFYRAGILNGSDAKGTFNPGSSIQRSEVAAILVRMMDAHYRVDAPAELGK